MSGRKDSRFLILLAGSLFDWLVIERNGSTDLVSQTDGPRIVIPDNGGLRHSVLLTSVRRICRYTTDENRPDVEALAKHSGWKIPADVLAVIDERWPVAQDEPGRHTFTIEREPAQEEPVPEPTPEQPEKQRATYQRGIAEKVAAELIGAGTARTTEQLVAATGFSRQQVHSACHGLVRAGMVRRIKTGVFVAQDVRDHSRVDVQHRAEGIVIGSATVRSVDGVAVAADQREAVIPLAPKPNVDVDIMNDVLDLMFPDGFKARHLPAIEDWKTATMRLIREVTS